MPVYLRKRKISGGITYYLDIYYQGRRWYEKTNLRDNEGNNKTNSRNIYEQAKAAQARRQMTLADGEITASVLSNTDFFAFFQSRIDRIHTKTVNSFKSVKKQFEKFLGKSTIRLNQINKLMCREFRVYLDKLNGETPHTYFARFKMILNDAVESGYLSKNPAAGVKNPNPTGKILSKEVLFDDEMILLFKTPIEHLEIRRVCLFACLTGLGMAEIRKMKWADVDLNIGIVKVLRIKNNEPVIVNLNEDAKSLLGTPKPRNENVFHLNRSDRVVNRYIDKWVKRAGISKHITFYCFRHSYATSILSNTGNLKLTSAMLGHTSTQHTEKYTHLIDQARKDAVNKLPRLSFDENGQVG